MSKAAVKISTDLLSNPLCEQDQAFLESMNALDTAMKRMDSFNQEKVRLASVSPFFCKLKPVVISFEYRCRFMIDC